MITNTSRELAVAEALIVTLQRELAVATSLIGCHINPQELRVQAFKEAESLCITQAESYFRIKQFREQDTALRLAYLISDLKYITPKDTQ